MPFFVHFDSQSDWPALCYGVLIALIICMQSSYIDILEESQKSVFMLQMPNVTSAQSHLYCGISYDLCRCSVILVSHCLTDEQVKIGRILPLASFVLQVYLIREILSLNRGYTLPLIFSTWITSLLIFIGILAVVYRYTCFYSKMVTIIGFTGCYLFTIVLFAFVYDNHRIDLRRQRSYT